jgi:hypothetical protein
LSINDFVRFLVGRQEHHRSSRRQWRRRRQPLVNLVTLTGVTGSGVTVDNLPASGNLDPVVV